jgi:outer membrane protein OmpA-like peptidoglycan-associated protein
MKYSKMLSSSALIAALILLSACGAAVPGELRDARTAYSRAAKGSAATLTPADLHKAHVSLQVAEKAWEADPDSYKVRDLAYIALRRAEMAEAKARTAKQALGHQRALAELADTEATLAQRTKDDLARARSDLNRTKGELKSSEAELKASQTAEQAAKEKTEAVATQLSAEQKARQAAEKRAAETLAALNKLAAVKEEARGLVITLSGGVLFRSDESTLLPGARRKLDQVAKALLAEKGRTLVVEGHTDSNGTAEHNQALSQARAQAVVSYLIGRGYPANLASAVGMGDTRPLADNKSAEGRANNRRVEIIVQPK